MISSHSVFNINKKETVVKLSCGFTQTVLRKRDVLGQFLYSGDIISGNQKKKTQMKQRNK